MTRKDKKKDVPVLLPDRIYQHVHKHAVDNSVSDQAAAHDLIMAWFRDNEIITKMAPYYRKAFIRGDHVWMGDPRTVDFRNRIKTTGISKRVHIRLTHAEWLEWTDLQSALVSPHLSSCLLLCFIIGYDSIVVGC